MVAEALPTSFDSKAAMYAYLTQQFAALLYTKPKFSASANMTMGLANAASMLFYSLNALADSAAPLHAVPVNWIGFYLLQSPDVMTLGPFQGKVACTEIRVGKGVCGTAVATGESQLVPDVHAFPGHIACDGDSCSELVVPIRTPSGSIVGVLDLDSTRHSYFDDEDRQGMESLALTLGALFTFPFERPAAASTTPKAAPAAVALPSVLTAAAPSTGRDAPVNASVTIGPLTISTVKHSVIASAAAREALETELSVLALPEIFFPDNHVVVANNETGRRVVFRASGAMACARQPQPSQGNGTMDRVPVTALWANSPYPHFDPKVDWLWRNTYRGDWRGADGQPVAPDGFAPLTPGDGINWTMLRDQTLPMLLFDQLDLFEDDLHDHGVSRMTVKLRVMPSAVFLLMRHFVRLDGQGAAAREVRVFHDAGAGARATVEVSDKVLPPEACALAAVQALLRQDASDDQLVAHMVTLSVTSQAVDL